MGRLRKVLVGAVAALATLTAGLVGAGTANAAYDENANLVLNAGGSSTLSPDYEAFKLVGYGTVHYGPSGETTKQSGDNYVESVTATDVNSTVAGVINDALTNAGVGSNASTASHELLNMASSDPKVPQIAGYLKSHVSSLGTGALGSISSDSKSVSFDVGEGLYLILHGSVNTSTGAFTPDDTVDPMIVSSKIGGLSWIGAASPDGEQIGTGTVKNGSQSAPTKSYTADGAKASDGSDVTDPHVGVGDTAHFLITMTVPTSASHREFWLTDTPDGYNIDQSTLHVYHLPNGTKVTSSSDTHLTSSNEITIHTGASDSEPYILWTGSVNNGLASSDANYKSETVPNGGFVIVDRQFDANPPATTPVNSDSIINKYSGQELVVTYDAKVTKDNASNTVKSDVFDYSGKDNPEPGNTTHNDAYDPLATFQKVMASDRNRGVNDVLFTLKNTGTNKYWTRDYDPSTGKWGDWSQSDSSVTIRTRRAPVSGSGTEADPYHYKDGIIDLDGLSDGTYTLTETGFFNTTSPATNNRGTVSPAGTDDEIREPSQSDAGLMDPNTSTTTVPITITVSHTSVSSSASGLTSGLWNQTQSGTPTKYVYDNNNTTPDPFPPASGPVAGTTYSTKGKPALFTLGNMKNISELPATGGEGILVGLILVALLLAIGGSFIAISRKMHKDREQAEGVRA